MNQQKAVRLAAAAIMVAAAVALVLQLSACGSGGGGAQQNQRDQVNRQASRQTAYLPHNHVEFNNYNAAQRLYDSPSTIIWCSTTWGNQNAPIITVPIAG